MSTYVVSDIHGYYQTFLNLLEQINFSDEDELYIIGDVVDRGLHGVKILQYVMHKNNIHLMLGNHEYMCYQYFVNPNETVIRRWNRNGNFYTLKGFDKLSKQEKDEVLSYIKDLPTELIINVNNKDYRLIHGFVGQDDERKVWNRPSIDSLPNIKERLVVGHTPVCEYVCPGNNETMYVYSSKLTANNDHFRILKTKGFIDIDCCVGYEMSAARLACLRLDDEKEFYQEVVEDIE